MRRSGNQFDFVACLSGLRSSFILSREENRIRVDTASAHDGGNERVLEVCDEIDSEHGSQNDVGWVATQESGAK